MRFNLLSIFVLLLCSAALLPAGGKKEIVDLEVKIFHCDS